MDLVIRLFVRLSHILLVSTCCSYGLKESVSSPFDPSAPENDEEEISPPQNNGSHPQEFFLVFCHIFVMPGKRKYSNFTEEERTARRQRVLAVFQRENRRHVYNTGRHAHFPGTYAPNRSTRSFPLGPARSTPPVLRALHRIGLPDRPMGQYTVPNVRNSTHYRNWFGNEVRPATYSVHTRPLRGSRDVRQEYINPSSYNPNHWTTTSTSQTYNFIGPRRRGHWHQGQDNWADARRNQRDAYNENPERERNRLNYLFGTDAKQEAMQFFWRQVTVQYYP